jgi:two-component system, NtrC family, response regulator GlrR
MKDVFSRLCKLARRDTSLFIEGESGTGKELVARAVHMASPRSAKPFVVVDCSAIPRTLIEAELFGHAKGAFTGAAQARQGKFVAAHGGTVFLDEIGELDLDLQPRLLRVLERREVCPVGGTTPIPVDVRVISATHRDLRREIGRHTFREDLFYRFAVASVKLPPLRERVEDVPLLIDAFVRHFSVRDSERYQIEDAAVRRLSARPWPGNVRELRNAVEELLVSGEPPPDEERSPANQVDGDPGLVGLGQFKEEKDHVIRAFEERYLRALLPRHGNNISASASAAGLDRVHLLRLLDKYGLRTRGAARDG